MNDYIKIKCNNWEKHILSPGYESYLVRIHPDKKMDIICEYKNTDKMPNCCRKAFEYDISFSFNPKESRLFSFKDSPFLDKIIDELEKNEYVLCVDCLMKRIKNDLS
jgi:hypothetical protein